MRITGGTLKGRTLKVPPGPVRPTQDRVREALFSSLASVIPDAHVLDLFAGTGSLGLEAWSRGAASVSWVEADPRVCAALRRTVGSLCGPEVAHSCIQADVFRFLQRSRGNTPPADFILADPPYDRHDPDFEFDLFLECVLSSGWLKADGLLVFEQRSRQPVREHPRWQVLRERSYGEARLIYYQPVEGGGEEPT